ncbi:hypothetical protein [Hoeflea sp.]|uniref:hypothetical protein n=1 Tax=Hoeflea sp. TaxID=1940281 RepID=UPI003A926C43
MKIRTSVLVGTFSLLLYTTAIPVAQSGSNNQLFLLQESTSGALTGNTLTVDQSGATGSLVSGPTGARHPAIQSGSGNDLEIELTGTGGHVQFIQKNVGNAAGNSAKITAEENAVASLWQLGNGNSASLNVTGPLASGSGLLASGSIDQVGLDNVAELTVDGDGASGRIRQIGKRNDADLTVTGAGTTATFTQIGNSLTTPGGVQVISNGATVTITQTAF